ncbi:MAG: hypothetical protein Q7R66_14150 [Undibacterium sp.]|uniref:hypothetical protein n=1 Tax=Undibacterium sp. TaxID=1914977 RepID=UPI002720C9D8|nr:hypothetical protein [Undibacterium sp.]MDO8653323.1 hypothetical protein [Undibacterium sp.]
MKSTPIIKKLFFTGLLMCAGFSTLATAHDRGWDRDHGWQPRPVYQREVIRPHNYIYYPAQQVYFSPANNNWFWASGNGWQAGARLPAYLNVDLRLGGVPVALRSERPYIEHAYVETSYGRPWRESHEWRRYQDDRHDYRRNFEGEREHGWGHGYGHDRRQWRDER